MLEPAEQERCSTSQESRGESRGSSSSRGRRADPPPRSNAPTQAKPDPDCTQAAGQQGV